jgi:Cu/Ag efflux pump CusA
LAVAIAADRIFLLQAAFTSWRLAALAFVTLPVALAGGLVAAVVAGGTLSLGSFAGMAAVLGLAARNGILMVRRYQSLEREGLEFGDELSAGTRERLAPVVTTAVAIIAAMVPLVVAGDVAGLEIVRPMAVVMLGGVVTSTLLAILVVPSLYLRHGFVARRDTVAEDLAVVLIPEAESDAAVVPGT